MKSVLARFALIALLTTSLVVVTQSSPASAAPGWWNASYSDRLAINVHANDAITSGYSLDVVINHARMVSQGFSLASGDDVRIAYYNGSAWTELDRVLAYGSSWNSATTDLVFKTQAAVSANSDDTGYYLYYGNGSAVSPPANANNVYALWDDFSSGTIDSSKWAVSNLGTGITVSISAGQLQISGTSDATNANTVVGIKSANNLSQFGYRYDSSFSIVSQDVAASGWKGSFATNTAGIAPFGGSGFDKRLVYNSGGNFIDIGDSSLDGQTFAFRRVTQTVDLSAVEKHYESGVLLAQRSGAPGTQTPLFAYSPNIANKSFDVRFDDIVVRKFVANEPTVTIESANDIAFVTTVAPVFSFTVASHSGGACNGATQTATASASGSAVALGRTSVGSPAVAIQDLTVASNANAGFTVGVRSPALLTAGSNTIAAIAGTNASPAAFGSGAGFGYTTNALSRFASKWAALTTTSSETLSGTGPTTATACVAYQLQVAATSPAGSYSGSLVYSAVPTF